MAQDVTDPANPIFIDGNAMRQLTMTDRSLFVNTDTLGITVEERPLVRSAHVDCFPFRTEAIVASGRTSLNGSSSNRSAPNRSYH